MSCSSKDQSFKGDYYFIRIDGELTKLFQRKDTLFEYRCNTDRSCRCTPESHYKVIDLSFRNNQFLFKLEKLDTIRYHPIQYPENRFSILVLDYVDSNRICFTQQLFGLTKKEVTDNFVDTFKTNKKFGLTYFSNAYYESFKGLKTISKRSEVEEIIALYKTDKYVQLVELYKISDPFDMYGLGLSTELFNNACIDKGYNPIGAASIANELLRK